MQQNPHEPQRLEDGNWKNGYIKEQNAKKHWTEMSFGWWFQIAAMATALYFAGKFTGKY